jgi:hypothetical protein
VEGRWRICEFLGVKSTLLVATSQRVWTMKLNHTFIHQTVSFVAQVGVPLSRRRMVL